MTTIKCPLGHEFDVPDRYPSIPPLMRPEVQHEATYNMNQEDEREYYETKVKPAATRFHKEEEAYRELVAGKELKVRTYKSGSPNRDDHPPAEWASWFGNSFPYETYYACPACGVLFRALPPQVKRGSATP